MRQKKYRQVDRLIDLPIFSNQIDNGSAFEDVKSKPKHSSLRQTDDELLAEISSQGAREVSDLMTELSIEEAVNGKNPLAQEEFEQKVKAMLDRNRQLYRGKKRDQSSGKGFGRAPESKLRR